MSALSRNLQNFLRVALANDAAYKELAALLAPAVGTKVSVDGLEVSEQGIGPVRKTVLTLKDFVLNVTDATTAGAHGSQKLYDFPEGHIKIIGAHAKWDSIVAGSGGIGNSAEIDIGVGTVAASTSDETLSSTEQNIVTKADISLSNGAGSGDAVNTTDLALDGSSTAIDAFLNVAVTAATSDSDDTLTISGIITIHWVLLGDD